MDDAERLAVLEEELAILKGEIKSILQEVRIALLSRDNPFSAGFFEPVPHPSAAVASPPPTVEAQVLATADRSLRTVQTVPARSESPAPDVGSRTYAGEPAVGGLEASAGAGLLESRPTRPVVSGAPATENADQRRTAGRWSRRQMATLMSWTQEIAGRFCRRDFILLLTIARHGGLVDRQLQETLAELAESLACQESAPATINDFLLALHQLEAVVAPGDAGGEATRAA